MTRKRLLLWVGLPLLLVLVAIAAAYGFRRDIAAWAIDRELAKLGLQGTRYTIGTLDPEEAVFTDLTLPDGRLAAKRLRATYDLGDLLGGRVERIEVDGLRAAPSAVQMLLGDGGGEPLVLPSPLPELILTDAKVGIPTALGVVSATLELSADQGGSHLQLVAALPDPVAALPDYSARSSDLTFSAQGTLPPLAELAAQSSDALIERLRLAGTVELSLAGLSLPGQLENLDLALPLSWRFEQGRLELSSDQGGKVGRLTLPGYDAGDLTLQAGPLATLTVGADGYDVALTPDLRLDLASGPWLHLAATAATRLDRAFVTGPITIEPLLAEGAGWSMDEHTLERFTLTGSLGGNGQRLAGPVELDVAMSHSQVGLFPLEGVTAKGAFDAVLTPAGLSLALREPAAITVRQVYDAETPLLTEPLEASMEHSDLDLDWSDGLRLQHDTTLALGRHSFSFGGLPVSGDFGQVQLAGQTYDGFAYGGRLQLAAPQLELPAYGLTLQTVALTWVFPAPGEAATPAVFSIGDATLRNDLGTMTGMTLAGEILQAGPDLSLTGEGKGPGGSGTLSVKLESDSDSGKGSGVATWGPVAFKPQGLQPAALLSFFKDFKEVSGSVKATLTLGWSPDKESSELALALTDISFQHPQALVEGLNGKLVLDRLDQISTRPAKITIRSIDVGLPITDIATTLRIKPGKTPSYQLTDTVFTMTGGRFSLPSLTYSESAKEIAGTLDVKGLDLAELSQELAIDELTLEGRMDGTLPFSITPSDETFVVTGGRLAATGPGVIRYGTPGTADIRAGGDSNFALALQTLEDFHYKVFDLGFDKAADGNTKLKITLEGANPAVLDGYPFRLNINLTTDLTQVLQALRDGYRLNPDLFKGGWTFQ